ncbi:MAG: hypothetical protein JNL02_03115 [Saprospiraceae bacterium]|nr:hypothetical protein [Saprospiraceae bacterium]
MTIKAWVDEVDKNFKVDEVDRVYEVDKKDLINLSTKVASFGKNRAGRPGRVFLSALKFGRFF